MVTAGAVAGALIGARLTATVNPDAIRKVFGWFVLAMSSVILARRFTSLWVSAPRYRPASPVRCTSRAPGRISVHCADSPGGAVSAWRRAEARRA